MVEAEARAGEVTEALTLQAFVPFHRQQKEDCDMKIQRIL